MHSPPGNGTAPMAAQPPPASPRSPALGRAVPTWILILAGYVVVTVWWLWPLPAMWSDHAIYPRSDMPEVAADFHLITWALAWDTHALLTQPAALFDANIFFPAPRALAFSEHFLGYVPLFAPTFLLSGNPILASNLLLFATYPLCALAMYALARRFVSAPAAAIAGFLFAFCGPRYANLYHFHQLGSFYLPLVLLLTERWLERARAADAAALGLCITLQLLSTFYLGYALLALYAVYLPIALLHWRRALDRRRIVGLAIAVAAAAVAPLLASLPYLEMQRLGLIPSSHGQEVIGQFTMDPSVTALQVQRYLTQNGLWPVGYALAAVALLRGWRATGEARDPRHARVISILSIATGLVLAFGPRIRIAGVELWSPYELAFRFLPGFAAIRLPYRFLVLAQLGAALLVALGLEQLLAWLRATRPRSGAPLAWASAAAVSALALVGMPVWTPHTLHSVAMDAQAAALYRRLGEARDANEGGALLELPLADVATSAKRMAAGTAHWRPMIDGYSAYPPLTRNYLRRVAAGLPAPQALQGLVDLVDVGWIAVHLGELDPRARAAWAGRLPDGLAVAGRFGDHLLLRVTLPRDVDRRALLVSTTETIGGVPLAPLGRDCPGRLRAALIDAPRALRPGANVRLGAEVQNGGSAAWPGFGLYPRFLVQLRVKTVRADGSTVAIRTIPLWRDVPAGRSVGVGAEIAAPSAPGDYTLEVGLVQDATSLARCGVAEVRLPLRVGADRPAPRARRGGAT